MSHTGTPDDVERRLDELFARQARDLDVPVLDWDDTRVARVTAPHRAPAGRPAATGLALAGCVAAAVILVAVTMNGSDPASTAPAASTIETDATVPTVPSSATAEPSVRLETGQVSLVATGGSIEVGGTTFTPSGDGRLFSQLGMWHEYTSLEAAWVEDGVEMRLIIHFRSDGREWWSDSIWIYDGTTPGEWLFAEGDFFRTAVGEAFVGDLDLTASDHGMTGRITFTGLRLEAFRRPVACDEPGPLALEPGARDIDLEGGYGLWVYLFDTARCEPVADPGRYDYAWSTGDPAVVSIVPLGARADLWAEGAGETTVHITVVDPATGAVVAEADVVVRATGPGQPVVQATSVPPADPATATTTTESPHDPAATGDAPTDVERTVPATVPPATG
jgi:hypothetical protein